MVTVIRVTPAEAAALAAAKSPTKNNGNNNNENGGGKKRALPSTSSGKENSKRQRVDDRVNVDLSDVPPQLPIPKSEGRIKEGKEGASKYTGVSFDKRNNRWTARVMIDGKARHIGNYKNEEDAAADYARAVVKYKGQDALDKARERKSAGMSIDLSDVPPQLPILKRADQVKESSSKFTGVSFNKAANKWRAEIKIEGKTRYLGCYENEEEAAIDYAKAVFKYKGEQALDKEKKSESTGSRLLIDLRGVPPQLPIPKSGGWMKDGGSKYAGVTKAGKNKWKSQIWIEGKQRCVGHYVNEEEAAIDYARAVFKYQGQEALDKARARGRNISGPAINILSGKETTKKHQRTDRFVLDFSDVPPKPPILKSTGRMKEGASKYTGVSFNKANNKWLAQLVIEGKQRYIGSYENEEEAAIDYARAVFKYHGQEALAKLRGQKSLDESGERTLPANSIDLRGVPPQQPIPKSGGWIKEGASKYAGVHFNKASNKWKTQLMIEGKTHYIGLYENEEEAANDYARAVFKYQGQEALDKARARARVRNINIDLSDVSPQPPILKSTDRVKEGASKYTGVTYDKAKSKWKAQIVIDGKQQTIGYYENEEEAAIDYAKAVFKYKGQDALDEAREPKKSKGRDTPDEARKQKKLPLPAIDLSGVLPQPLILKSADQMKEGFSKYAGVYFNKSRNIWTSTIRIDGNLRHIGYYKSEEEAAIDYARAAFKYQKQCHNL